MPELLLALDCGTTTVRACLFSPEGELLARDTAATRSRSDRPGQVEQDAAWLWRLSRKVMQSALAQAGRSAADVAAVGVTTQRASLVAWDKRTGRPLSPLVVWSDLRGVARARELQAAGFLLSPQQAAAKLEGVIAAIPDAPALARAGRLAVGNVDSFLVFKLTGGRHVTDRSQAWPSGYLDLTSGEWNAALIEHQGLDARIFPELVDSWGEIGRCTADALGAPAPLAAIVADQQSALIGQDGEATGGCKVSYGTSATLDVSTGERFTWLGPGSAPFITSAVAGRTRFCLEGMVYAAGSALDWARRTLRLGSLREFEGLAAGADDSAGVVFLPALQGLGTPYADLSREGLVGGLTGATGRAELARAALEGIGFRVREAFEHLYAGAELAMPDVLPVDGGLTGNALFLQIQSDILGRPIARHAVRDAAAAGAAVAAGRGAGLFGEHETPVGFARRDLSVAPRWSADQAQSRIEAWRSKVYPDGSSPPSFLPRSATSAARD